MTLLRQRRQHQEGQELRHVPKFNARFDLSQECLQFENSRSQVEARESCSYSPFSLLCDSATSKQSSNHPMSHVKTQKLCLTESQTKSDKDRTSALPSHTTATSCAKPGLPPNKHRLFLLDTTVGVVLRTTSPAIPISSSASSGEAMAGLRNDSSKGFRGTQTLCRKLCQLQIAIAELPAITFLPGHAMDNTTLLLDTCFSLPASPRKAHLNWHSKTCNSLCRYMSK